jgi:protein-S-isoprenylcysteine O-methyltransferase Ste14
MSESTALFLAAVLHLPPHDWPALAVGLIVAVYWWRVLRMAYKMRRQTGRAANLIPTERIGRLLRIVWQPIVWVWVGHPLVAACLANPPAALRPIYHIPSLQWLAVFVALLAFLATRVCWKRMGKSWRMGIDPGERTALVVTGPYAYVRHPIYALSSVLMVATVIAVPTPLMVAVGAVHLLLLQWEARREEQHLSRVHGEQYDRYCSSVGRFVPKTFRSYAAPAAPSAS